MDVANAEPYFKPFIGRDYRHPTTFPRPLLVVGESHYLKRPEDNHPGFIQDLVTNVSNERSTPHWPTPFYRNLFYLLTGHRGREVTDAEWWAVWQSLAFYNFAQTDRLKRPLERPTKDEWERSIPKFRSVLSQLRPELVIITGRIVTAYATDERVGKIKKEEGTIGVWLPIGSNRYAFTRCVYHPSSRQTATRREEQRELIAEMLERDWPVPNQDSQKI